MQLLLRVILLKRFEVKQRKIKAMLRYFWLNYCDENRIKRIPIVVKNIDHPFHLASEADSFNFLAGLELMIMNT